MLGVAIVAACLASFCWTQAPDIEHSSALNALFDSRLLIAVAKVVVLVGLIYVLASICIRAARGQWVARAGSVAVDDPTQALADDQNALQGQLVTANATIRDLPKLLADYVDSDARTRDILSESPASPGDTSAEEELP